MAQLTTSTVRKRAMVSKRSNLDRIDASKRSGGTGEEKEVREK
jgi:hypothetical protein